MVLQFESSMVRAEIYAHGPESAISAGAGHALGVDIWGQHEADVRLEWGPEGVGTLGGACAVLVIVDVLSFSTTTDLALGRGARVLPVRWRDHRAAEAAKAAGATLAGEGAWTLRPSSVTEIPSGTLLALPSPNGATLCNAAAQTGAEVLVPEALAQCSSGRELAAGGHANDVTLAARLDTSSTVPVLRKGILETA